MKVIIPGQGAVSLHQRDFVAKGGEGSIYVRGDVAYKIYDDPARALSPSKLAELDAIVDNNVIKPRALLLDAGGRAIGYSMRYVAGAWPLVRLCARSFKEQHGVGFDAIAAVVRELAARIRSVHAAGALIVDVSEMNFLVAARFDAVFAIDVDSYQTPHHPATAVTPAIRDPRTLAGGFDEGSDWFAFAVLTAQLYVGVHPYKGKHPDAASLDERMRRQLSFFDARVRLPRVAYPLDVIPARLRGWLKAVLDGGERSPPPDALGQSHAVVSPARVAHAALDVAPLFRLPSTIRALWIDGGALWSATDDGLYRNARRVAAAPPPGSLLALSPAGRPLLAWRDGRRLALALPEDGIALEPPAEADAIMQTRGRIYLASGDKILELLLRDVGASVICSTRLAAATLPHATRLFEGVAVQSLLGACYVSLFPESGVHQQIHVRELDQREVVDARADGNVAVLLVRHGHDYTRALLRVAPDGHYHLHSEPAARPELLPFVRLGSGVCIRLCDDDAIELSSADPRRHERRRIAPEDGAPHMLWRDHGGRLVCAAGNEVMRLSSRAL